MRTLSHPMRRLLASGIAAAVLLMLTPVVSVGAQETLAEAQKLSGCYEK